MRMRNVLIFGLVVSAVAASAILLSGCETYPSQRSYQVMPGPPVPTESVVIVVPEQGQPGYDKVRHEGRYGRDENRREEENARRGENARREENARRDEDTRREGNRGRDGNVRHEVNDGHVDSAGHPEHVGHDDNPRRDDNVGRDAR